MATSLFEKADQATRNANAYPTKGSHLRAAVAHEKAAQYASEIDDSKAKREHTKQAKEHRSQMTSASSSSSDSSDSNPLDLWMKKKLDSNSSDSKA